MSNWISGILLLFAVFFFVGGTVGLLRFPDVYSRLHALTKADNIGWDSLYWHCSFRRSPGIGR